MKKIVTPLQKSASGKSSTNTFYSNNGSLFTNAVVHNSQS